MGLGISSDVRGLTMSDADALVALASVQALGAQCEHTEIAARFAANHIVLGWYRKGTLRACAYAVRLPNTGAIANYDALATQRSDARGPILCIYDLQIGPSMDRANAVAELVRGARDYAQQNGCRTLLLLQPRRATVIGDQLPSASEISQDPILAAIEQAGGKCTRILPCFDQQSGAWLSMEIGVGPARPAALQAETLEPRILMSATWVDADDIGDTDDTDGGFELPEGAAALGGGPNLFDDDGGDSDPVAVSGDAVEAQTIGDYSGNASGVSVDMTTGAVDGGAPGTQFDAVNGSSHDDTFSFSDPAAGDSFTVNGGDGENTIDLSNFDRGDVSFSDGEITVQLADGGSFTIEHSGIDQVQFGDQDVRFAVWDGDASNADFSDPTNWSGDSAPGPNDILVFDATSGDSATLDASFGGTIGGLIISDDYSGRVTVNEPLTIAGDLDINGGQFYAGNGDLTVEGNLEVDGGYFRASRGVTSVGGDFSMDDGTFHHNSGTFRMVGTGDHTFDGGDATFQNLELTQDAGSLSVNESFVVRGNLTQSGAAVDASNAAIEFQGHSQINTGSMTFGDVTLNGYNVTVTGEMDIDGDLTMTSVGRLDGDALRVAGDIVTTDTSTSGSAMIFLDGDGDQVISAAGGTGELHDFTVDKASGSVTVQDNLQISGNMTVANGDFDATGATIEFQGGNTIDAGSGTFGNVVFNTGNVTVNGTMDVDGDLNITRVGRFNGGQVTVAGDITTTDTSYHGSVEIVLDGAGDQVIGSNGGTGELHDFSIDKASGTVTVEDHLQVSGNFTLANGTFDASGATVEFQSGNNISAAGAQFGDVVFNTGNVTIDGELDIDGDLTIKSLGVMNGDAVRVAGDITTTDTNTYGSSVIILDGAGDQVVNAAGGTGEVHDLTIDKASGSVTLTDNLQISGNLDVSNGDVDASGATIEFQRGNTISAEGVQFGNVTFNTGNVTIDGELDIDGDLTIKSLGVMNGDAVRVAGDVTTTDTNTYGSSVIILDGAGDQVVNAAGGTGEVHDLTIDKASGSVTLTDNLQISGNLDVSNGNVDASGATIEFQRGNTISAEGVQFGNVTFNTGNVTIDGELDIDGDLTIKSLGVMNGDAVRVSGDITTTDTNTYGSSVIILDGAGDQVVNAAGGTGEVHDLTIDKASGSVTLTDNLQISGNLDVSNGNVDASGATIEFQRGNTISAEGIQFGDVTFNTGNVTIDGELDIDGDLTIKSLGVMNGDAVRVSGDITTTDTNTYGSSVIILDGAGDQVVNAGGGTGEVHDLTIDKASGSVTLTDNLQISGNLDVSNGNVDASGATIEFQRGNTISAEGIQFGDVTFNTGNVTIDGELDIDGDLTIKSLGVMNGDAVRVSGDITTTDTNTYGSSVIVLDGTGDQVVNAGGGTGEVHDLTIDKASGSVTLQDNLQVSGNFVVSNGDVDASGATIEFQRGNTIDAADVSFGDVTFYTGNVNIVGGMDIDGDLHIRAAGYINGDNIHVAGNVTTTDTSMAGTSTVVLDGSGNQTIDAAGGTGEIYRLEINKPDGAVTLQDQIQVRASLTVTSGEVDARGAVVEFQGSPTVDAADMRFGDVTLSASTINVVDEFFVEGDLTVQALSRVDNGTIYVAGNINYVDSSYGGTGQIINGVPNDAPVANAGVDQVVDEDATITLDASGSIDPEGSGLTFNWTQTSGPTVALDDAAASQPSFSSPDVSEPTIVTFQVEVSDGDKVHTDNVSITINPVNHGPVADAGADQTVNEDGVVTLDASGSYDPDVEDSVTFTWNQTGGPSVTLDDPSAAKPSFSSPDVSEPTVLTFEVEVNDRDATQTDTVEITVNPVNHGPVADAGADQTVNEDGVVTLDASGSYDPDVEDSVTFNWTQTDGPSVTLDDPSAAKPSFSSPDVRIPTVLTFEVEVDDGDATHTDLVEVTVNPVPVDAVDFPHTDSLTDGDAEGFNDVSGEWTLSPDGFRAGGVDAPNDWAISVLDTSEDLPPDFTVDVQMETHAAPGKYHNGFIIFDYNGPDDFKFAGAREGANYWTIGTFDGNWNDLAKLSEPIGTGQPYDLHLEVDQGSVSLSVGGTDKVSFDFQEDVSDGGVGLAVDFGETSFRNLAIDNLNHGPVADAGADQTVDEDGTITLDASGSYDPDVEDSVTFTWNQTGGPSVTLDDPSAAKPSFSSPDVSEPTVLSFEVEVNDGDATHTDTVEITVNPVNHGPVADAGADQTVDEDGTITLDASGSYDPDVEDSVTFTWNQTGGPSVTLDDPSAAKPSFSSPDVSEPTVLTFEVEVNDGDATHTDTVEITVNPVNTAPVADADIDNEASDQDLIVLDATESYDPDVEDQLKFSWQQLDGPTVALDDPFAARPKFTSPDVTEPTMITFEVMVDDGEEQRTDTVEIMVEPIAERAPAPVPAPPAPTPTTPTPPTPNPVPTPTAQPVIPAISEPTETVDQAPDSTSVPSPSLVADAGDEQPQDSDEPVDAAPRSNAAAGTDSDEEFEWDGTEDLQVLDPAAAISGVELNTPQAPERPDAQPPPPPTDMPARGDTTNMTIDIEPQRAVPVELPPGLAGDSFDSVFGSGSGGDPIDGAPTDAAENAEGVAEQGPASGRGLADADQEPDADGSGDQDALQQQLQPEEREAQAKQGGLWPMLWGLLRGKAGMQQDPRKKE